MMIIKETFQTFALFVLICTVLLVAEPQLGRRRTSGFGGGRGFESQQQGGFGYGSRQSSRRVGRSAIEISDPPVRHTDGQSDEIPSQQKATFSDESFNRGPTRFVRHG